jgi:hypothetical protein
MEASFLLHQPLYQHPIIVYTDHNYVLFEYWHYFSLVSPALLRHFLLVVAVVDQVVVSHRSRTCLYC